MRNWSWALLWRYAVIWAAVGFALFPILWLLSASFDPSNTLVGQRLIPRNPSWSNYQTMFTSTRHPFVLWLWNSVKIGLVTSLLALTATSLAAYAFSRFRFQGRRTSLFTLLLIQVFPQMLAMVAIYFLLLRLGEHLPLLGINSHSGLILTYLGGAMGVNIWLMKGYFDTIPNSLEESAIIDGATPFVAFWRIILPLCRPILVVVFMLQFIGTYSEFILARVLLSSTENYTLALGMQLFIADQYGQRWGIFAAAAVLGALPIIVLFMLLQGSIISGLTRGAVKE